MLIKTPPIELYSQPFFTDEQTAILLANWYTAGQDHKPVVKLSLHPPNNVLMCWLFYALDPEYPELASGLCDHGWGRAFMDMIYLPHLLNDALYYRTPLLRDPDFVAHYPLSVYQEAAIMTHGITTDPAHLALADARLKQRQLKL